MKADVLYYSSNELRSGVPQKLQKAEDLAGLLLDYGWLDVEGNEVLVERKEFGNLATDLRNGHLKAQLESAKAHTPHVWLLTEGIKLQAYTTLETSMEWIPGQWKYGHFLAAMLALVCGLQVNLVGSQDKTDSACILWALFLQTRRVSLGSGKPVLARWRATRRNPVVESYARAIPGLGLERAERLAEGFASWELLCEARKAQIRKLPGFGPLLSEKVYSFVRLKHGE